MELATLITVLCVCFSFMLQSASCGSQHVLLKSSANERGHDSQQKLPAGIPRKLKLMKLEPNEVDAFGKKTRVRQEKQEEATQGKLHHKEADLEHARKGTREEWVERADASQFFTMDYLHVKKRLPIHNKLVPVAP